MSHLLGRTKRAFRQDVADPFAPRDLLQERETCRGIPEARLQPVEIGAVQDATLEAFHRPGDHGAGADPIHAGETGDLDSSDGGGQLVHAPQGGHGVERLVVDAERAPASGPSRTTARCSHATGHPKQATTRST